MTLPEGWPTLQEIMRATAHLANGDAPDWHVNYRLTNAASFAVTAYPALTALVERWRSEEYADAMMLNEAAVSQADRCADELAAILARTKETRE